MKIAKLSTVLLLLVCKVTFATDYYVHPNGDDNAVGTNKNSALKTLQSLSSLSLEPGDNIYLAAGETFYGSLKLAGASGSEESPITISSYGDGGSKAIIDAKNMLAAIELVNPKYINVSNIEITADGGTKQKYRAKNAMRLGVLVDINDAIGNTYGYLNFDNIFIHHIFSENPGVDRGDDVATANGTQAYGYGVRLYNSNNHDNTVLTDVSFKNSEIHHIGHTAFKTTSNTNRKPEERRWGNIYNVELIDNYFHDIGGPGIQFGGINGGYVAHNRVHRTGSQIDERMWARGSGMWPWGARDLLIEHNEFTDASGPADSAGFHIDFNCTNVIVQYNLSRNNAGGFIEILGNNENNTYRYNISINDGYRQKGIDGAQDGKVIWLSGFVGKDRPKVAPKNNYIYNNTIFVKSEQTIHFGIHNETQGVVIANNIFAIEGQAEIAPGSEYIADSSGTDSYKDLIITNNLFIHDQIWPDEMFVTDSNPIYEAVTFANKGGNSIADYQITSDHTILASGIDITRLPNDSYGLTGGMQLEKDILGNTIGNHAHIGAVFYETEEVQPAEPQLEPEPEPEQEPEAEEESEPVSEAQPVAESKPEPVESSNGGSMSLFGFAFLILLLAFKRQKMSKDDR
ncbi:right-handed parallel beta-helix repeat-containing protein [Colwellia piezophila]|uniref:right-handed parallel beta-helix repeat-containing protein n=1 Tax=Colwellia piezophila TaxID=211668 RepID=UPI00146D7286|nr:right-handed parallel beta-helix repeat-containing protein [Colwellia piezophila]